MSKLADLSNVKFGKTTVLFRVERPDGVKFGTYWMCECECGNRHISSAGSLKAGGTMSCGCYHRHKTSMCNFLRNGGKAGYWA